METRPDTAAEPMLAADVWRRRPRLGASAAFALASLVLHVGAGAALLVGFHPHLSGAVPTETGAISIELVNARDLETIAAPEVAAAPPTPPQLATAPATPERAVDSEPEPRAEVEPAPSSRPEIATAEPPLPPTAEPLTPEPPAEIATAAPAPVAPDVSAAPPPAEPQSTTPVREAEPVPAADQPPPLPLRRPAQQRAAPDDIAGKQDEEAPRRPIKPQRRAEGATAPPPSPASAGSAARAAASRGALVAYRSRVQSHVASRRPAGIGTSGHVVIGFGLSPSGGLAYASVAQSSGNAALDRLALSSVRAAAPFPPPPAGSRSGDLRFAFPYTFR